MVETRRFIGTIICVILTLACVPAAILQAAEEKQLSSRVLEALEKQFHDTFVALRSEYGLHPFLPADRERVADKGKGGRNVILVHGLDDPGLIWQDLAPTLAEQNFRVFIMSYPNDQPVRDSADFFFRELQGFADREGTAAVAIVAHSMGGLVAREMATSPALCYAKAEEARLVPPLSHFIMIGTPNHGSIFSRLRLLTELRDQMVIGAEKGFHWLRPIVDGQGEAANDLYPDSDFLTALNSRPLPSAGRMLVIAGVMSPFQQGEAVTFLRGVRDAVPGPVQPPTSLETFAAKMIDQVGDGLVSVDSVRLPDVPLVQVQGTHVTIIRNLGGESSRIPPAIPVVLRELQE